MKPSKLFFILVSTALFVYAVVGFYFLPLASFEGDLTRLSKLPETEFGWTKPQAVISPSSLQQASWQEADVLVVGDSFSMPHLWQTVLTQRRLRVRTETWENIRGVCADFSPWLAAQGFKGRHIILETVERHAEGVIARSVQCEKMQSHSVSYPLPAPPIIKPNHQADYSGVLSVGIQTEWQWLNYLRLSQQENFKQWKLPNDVNLVRLDKGCDWFSHHRCKDVLFYAEDSAEDIDEKWLNQIAILNNRLGEIKPIWVIVPNKSTTYLYSDKRFWNLLAQHFVAPNLLGEFRHALEQQTVDLYPGNNTHLSTRGYLLMGAAISRMLPPP